MALDLIQLLRDNPEVVLFILLALAYLIGNLHIGSFKLGSPPGMLIASLFFGYFGFEVFEGLETLGLYFFLYAIAFQAGPAFFNVVLPDGIKYIILAAIATGVGFALTLIFSLIFKFDTGTAAGLLTGSLTSPPGVAAALETAPEALRQSISISYALTFLVGDISVLLLARNIPNLFRFDLVAESRKAAEEKKVKEAGQDMFEGDNWSLTLRAYQVNNPSLVGKTIAEFQDLTECLVLRYKRKEQLYQEFPPETVIELGDRLLIWGPIAQQDILDQLFGAEVADADLLKLQIITQDITVNKQKVFGKSLDSLGIHNKYACHLTKIARSGINLQINPELEIARGDVLTVSGPEKNIEKLTREIGYMERDVNSTDLVTFAAGIVAGVILGQINISLFGINLGLGNAGGLLFVGICIGYLRSIHPTFGRVPPATLWVFKQLGLLFFLAAVGIRAGNGLAESLNTLDFRIFLCSLVIATTPVLAVFIYGFYVLKMNPALALGASTGAVTCTPAMAAVSTDARSSIPTIGYAGTFPFATILQALAASLMTLISLG